MRLTSSLTNRIFIACTLLAMLSLGFAFSFVNERASVEAEAELRRGLTEAGTLVDENRVTLTETFTRLARLVADLPKLKAAVETGDPPTVQPLADEYLKQINADLLVLTGRRATVIGSAGAGSAGLPPEVYESPTTDEVSTFWSHPRGLLQVISVPIFLGARPPEILGRLTVGFFLDDRRAVQLKRLTGSEIAFGARGRVLASTLPASTRPQLLTALHAADIVPLTLNGEEFLALSRPLLSADGSVALPGTADTPVALILRSRTERVRYLSTIRTGLVGVLVVTLLLATIVSYAVARTMTRPLTAISNAMRHVAATGDLTRKVSLRSRPWDDEDARLLASAFNTLTESIARFQKEAAQKDRLLSLGRLSTVIAHEIRNPLMIVKASLSTLRRPAVAQAELREAITDIDDEVTRLNRIVTEVLDFAKPIRFELAEANLNDICRASATAATAGNRDNTVHFDLDPSVSVCTTDAERLRTALVNVLTNAHHAVLAIARSDTGTHGPNVTLSSSPSVVLQTRRHGNRVTISIQDRGIGIAPEDMAHIFDPYFTTRRAGTGLGLPIAKNIVEGLGGTIAVSSRPGEGSEIQIDLPLVPVDSRS
jgi:signal transduction histidine kinase